MAKKEKNYYDINTDAVDRLVNANEKTAPEVSEEEIAKYRGRKKLRIPNLVKVIFIKWWFNGAICFFFYFGLGTAVSDTLDLLFILGAALGLLTDLLTNHILRFIENTERENDRYMMVTVRKFWSIFLNFPYAYLLLICVERVYTMVNVAINQGKGTTDEIYLAVEPVLFGILYMLFDFIFIAVKNLFVKILNDAKKSAGAARP